MFRATSVSPTRHFCLGLNIIILLMYLVGVSHGQDTTPFIRPKEQTDTEGLDNHDQVVQFVDLSGLGSGFEFSDSSTLEIQLLQDLPIWTLHQQQYLETSNGNTFKPTGYFVGESEDHLISCHLLRYVSSDEITVTTGVVQDRENHVWYEIKPNSCGQDTVTAIRDEDLPLHGDPVIPSLWDQLSNLNLKQIGVNLQSSLSNRLGDWISRQESITRIDVMVIWTHDAECEKSLLATGCTLNSTTLANMEAAVDLMVNDGNTVFYTNSGTNLVFNLIHKQRDTSGYRVTDSTIALDHMRLGTNNLGYIGDLRAQYKADLVQMVYNYENDESGFSGFGYYPQPGLGCAAWGFSTIASLYMSMEYGSAHEWGHNLGCRHDRGTEDQCGDIFYTFYGYRNPSASWRTVMSYNCRSGQCDNSPGTTCSTIPYLSGDYTYNGESLGGASNNCRAAVIANKECISGYM